MPALRPVRIPPLVYPGVAVFAVALLLLGVGRIWLPFLEPEEALYAEIGREMAGGGNWLVPHLHHEPYLDKPPLLYWLTALGIQLLGPNVFGARLVAVLVALPCVGVVYCWGKAVGGPVAGLTAAAVLTLSPDFAYRGPMLTPNGLLALFTSAALAAGHVAVRGDHLRWRWWLLAAALTAAGVLTKGVVAVVLVAPVVAWGVVRALRGRKASSFLLARLAFAGVVLLLAGPWFAAVAAQRPGFLEYFFWKHHVERFTDPFDHAKPWHFYLPQVAVYGLPWVLVPAGFGLLWLKRKGWTRMPTGDALLPLAAAAFAVLFFSASGSKRAVYLVPVWPPFAVGVGVLLAPHLRRPVVRIVNAVACGITAAAIGWGVFYWLPDYHQKYGVGNAAEAIAAAGPGVPVVHTPHPWNSLLFDGLPAEAFRDDERAKLLAKLRAVPKCVVVTKDGPPADELTRGLPPDLSVVRRTECGAVAVLEVERR